MRRGNRPEGRGRGAPLALKVIAIVAILLAAVWVNLNAGEIEAVRDAASRAGYPGLFLAAISAGMTCGDLLGYLIGRATRSATRDIARGRVARFQARAEALGRRHRLLPLGLLFLYAAFVPLPNELVVIPMAFLRYSLAPVMAAVVCGNAIFNALALGATGAFGM